MMKKWIGVFVLISACTLPVFAGGQQQAKAGAAASKQAVQLQWWDIADQTQIPILDKIYAGFQKLHPNVSVQETTVNPWENLYQKALVSFAGGTPPDILRAKDFWVPDFASRGALEDLTPWIDKSKGLNISADQFIPIRWQSAIYRGQMYSLPWTNFTEMIFYNTDLLKNAGYDQPPNTWAQEREVALKTTDAQNKQWGTMLYTYNRVGPAMGEYWEILLMQAGGSLMNKDATKFTFDSPAGVTALQYQLDMLYKDKSMMPPAFGSLTSPAETGHIAMWWAGPWEFAVLPKEFPSLHWKPFLPPKNLNRAVYGVGNNLVMPKDSKHKQQAWDLMEYAFSASNNLLFNSKAGYLPSRIDSLKMPPYSTDPNWKIEVAQFERPDTHSRPYPLGFTEIETGIATWLQKAYLGEVSASVALKNAQEQANTLLAKYNK